MPAMSQDMVIIHRVFRREFALLPDLIRLAPPGDLERRDRLAAHLQLVLGVLEHHHEGEDLLLWPRLSERAPEAVELCAEMEKDHDELHGLLADVQEALTSWQRDATAPAAMILAQAVAAVVEPLSSHLNREEELVLPLVDRWFTQEEWNELGARAMSMMSPADAMIVLAQMGEESPEPEWAGFMSHLPPPVQEAYVSTALPAYPRYLETIRGA